MKILTAEELRKADAYTIAHEPIKSIELMERAAKACVAWMTTAPLLNGVKHVKVFCGLGNNGGDGLAIARLLAVKKFKVEVFIIRHSDKCSVDFLANEKKITKAKGVKIHNITTAAALPSSPSERFSRAGILHAPSSMVVDCLFGSGLNKPVAGLAAEAIKFINNSGCPVVSIDMPSGLFSEQNELTKDTAIVRAAHTLTFQCPKLALLQPDSGVFAGDFTVLDIGLDKEYISRLPSKIFFVGRTEASFLLKKRGKFSHKGTYGHALIAAGSHGMMGAAVLSSRACLAAGAGLVTAHIPKCGYSILQTANPEVMVSADGGEEVITSIPDPGKYDAIGIGPGLGSSSETQNALKALIQNAKAPLVLDADALNILAENRTWLSFLQSGAILTPHPGEFRRLAGEQQSSYETLQAQKEFSRKYGVFVVLKGAYTCITCPDGEVYFNSTGNPGMATAGSGDVLTGILTGFLAQGYGPKKATVLGVYLHGLAGDIAVEKTGQESLIAGSIVAEIGRAFKLIRE